MNQEFSIMGKESINHTNNQTYEEEFVNHEGHKIKLTYSGNTFTAAIIKEGQVEKNVPVKIDPRWVLKKLADSNGASFDTVSEFLLLSDQSSDLQDAYRAEGYQRENQVKEHRISVVPNNSQCVRDAIKKEYESGYVEFGGEMDNVSDVHFICHFNVLSVIAWVKKNKNLTITKEDVTVGHGTIRHETEGFLKVSLPTTYVGFAGWKP